MCLAHFGTSFSERLGHSRRDRIPAAVADFGPCRILLLVCRIGSRLVLAHVVFLFPVLIARKLQHFAFLRLQQLQRSTMLFPIVAELTEPI